MAINTLQDSSLWKRFEAEAHKHQRDPLKLVTDYLNECLERWEDEELDEAIAQEAQQSSYHEEDAVALVQRYRRSKKNEHASS